MKTFYFVDIPYSCFGIETDDKGIITEAAPISKWMIGKHWSVIEPWLKKKNAIIQEIKKPGD